MNTVTEISIMMDDEDMKMLENLKQKYELSSYKDVIIKSIRVVNILTEMGNVHESKIYLARAIQAYRHDMIIKQHEKERNKRYENNI